MTAHFNPEMNILKQKSFKEMGKFKSRTFYRLDIQQTEKNFYRIVAMYNLD